MGKPIATVTIDGEFKHAKLTQDFEKASQSARKFKTQFQKDFKELSTSVTTFKNLIGGLAAGIGISGLVSIGKAALDSAAALDDMSESTGASVEYLSKLSDVARIGGGNIEQVEGILLKFQKALSGTDEESDNVAQALAAIGLKFEELKRLSVEQQFDAFARAMANFSDGTGKTNVLLALFGKQTKDAASFLKDYAENMDRAASLTTQQANEADRAQKAINSLGVEISNAARAILADFAPALSQMVKNIQALGSLRGIGLSLETAMPGSSTEKALKERTDKLSGVQKQLADSEKSLADQMKANAGSPIYGSTIGAVKQKWFESQVKLNQEKLGNLRSEIAALTPTTSMQAAETAKPQIDFTGKVKPAKTGGGGGGRSSAKQAGRDAGAEFLLGLREQIDEESLGTQDEIARKVLDLRNKARKVGVEGKAEPLIAEFANMQLARRQAEELKRIKEDIERGLDESTPGRTAMREYNRFVSEIEPKMRELNYSEEQITARRDQLWDAMQVAEYGDALKDVKEEVDNQKSIAEELGMVFSSAFEDAITKGADFRKILQGLEQDIIRIVTRNLVTEPLSKWITDMTKGMFSGGGGGGGGGGFMDWIGNAIIGIFGASKGAAFAGGNVIPFARGGVVSSPTLFRFGHGAGMMGEAGPEAILPLRRGRDGKLGVSGGAAQINMYISTPDVSSFRASQSQILADANRSLARGRRGL